MIYPRQTTTPSDVARHYDELDAFYRDVWGEHVHHGLWRTGRESRDLAVQQLIDYVAARAHLQPGDRVCDVGAGYGATARYLVKHYGAAVTALTLSPAQYDHACAYEPDAVNPVYHVRDWLANGLPSDAYDVIVSIECISHVPDKQRFWEEVARVVRPGGRFVLCAWLADEAVSPRQVRHLLDPICREGRLPSLAAASDYRAMIADAALALDTFEDLSVQVRRTWTVCSRRVLRKLLSDRRYIRYLRDDAQQNRRFVVTLFRLWLGFRTGAFRYGLFAGHKP